MKEKPNGLCIATIKASFFTTTLLNLLKTFNGLPFADFQIEKLFIHELQKPTSNSGGIYCLHIAYFVFIAYYPSFPAITEDELLHFVKHT